MKIALLIPIYEPRFRVLPFLKKFQKGDFDAFLVVDDGSGKDFASTFAQIESETPFRVLSYPSNKGKGYALKTGMAELQKQIPDLDFIVTADGDGQHAYEDILRVKEEAKCKPGTLILGSRDFDQMIKKSQGGRRWATFYFRLATGKKVGDTQTGLRAIPKDLFPLAAASYGDRYEYEMNFLLAAARQNPIEEVTIQTIYFDGRNDDTHFQLFWDSLRISRASLLYLLVSFLSYGLLLGIYACMLQFAFPSALSEPMQNLACLATAWGVSSLLDYFCLEFWVFHHKRGFGHSFPKFLFFSLAGLCLLFLASEGLKGYWPNPLGLVSLFQMLVGVFHYFTNHYWVFPNFVGKRG